MPRQLGNDSLTHLEMTANGIVLPLVLGVGSGEQKHCLPRFLPLFWFCSGAFSNENTQKGRKTIVKPIKKSEATNSITHTMAAFRKVIFY